MPGSNVASVCADCNCPLETESDTPSYRVPCPECGSTRRNHDFSLQLTAGAAKVGMTIKAKSMGNTKPRVELKQGPSYSHSLKKPVELVRLIDRGNDRYFEKVTDYESGELIHHNEEPLSEHQGHGSARKKP